MAKLEEYIPIVGQATIDDLRLLADRLKDKLVQHINSTPVGGGVAEILSCMVPLLRELGINTRWDVIKGGEQFFEVTKKFHNALHGSFSLKSHMAIKRTTNSKNIIIPHKLNRNKNALLI